MYNDQGIRIRQVITKTGQTTTIDYILDGSIVVQEKHSDGTVIDYFYDVDEKLIEFNYKDNIYFNVRNLRGDITKILDDDGNVVVEYTYDTCRNIIDIKEYE